MLLNICAVGIIDLLPADLFLTLYWSLTEILIKKTCYYLQDFLGFMFSKNYIVISVNEVTINKVSLYTKCVLFLPGFFLSVII